MTATEPDGAVPPRPPATGAPRDRRAAAAVALVVVGLLLWLGYRVTIGGEPHSFAAGATPPSTVELTAGKTYSIGLPGGRDQAVRLLGDPPSLGCSITPAGGTRQQLAVTAEPAGSRALHQIATFVAPSSGRAAVSCSGLPAVFVDDADDVGTDYAGLFLLLASIALAVGLPLLLSVLRRHYTPATPATPATRATP